VAPLAGPKQIRAAVLGFDLVQAPWAALPYPVGRRELAMDIVHPRVAGIDVLKKVIWVAVWLPGTELGGAGWWSRASGLWRQLRQMAGWLAALGVTDTAMESTGVYWWPG
jgi:hypothetical protein